MSLRAKQLSSWRSLILAYCQHHGLTILDVTSSSTSPLFHNSSIQRRLSSDDIQIVLDDLKSHGHLEWIVPGSRCHIYWRTPDEWGQLIYDWAKENGMTNAVCTLYEIVNENEAEAFHKLEEEMLIKALKTLEVKKKAEVFGNNEGVKFL